MQLLKQPLGKPLSLAKQVITLVLANNRFFDSCELLEVKKVQEDVLSYFDATHPEIAEEINRERVLTEELTNSIIEISKEYKAERGI